MSELHRIEVTPETQKIINVIFGNGASSVTLYRDEQNKIYVTAGDSMPSVGNSIINAIHEYKQADGD